MEQSTLQQVLVINQKQIMMNKKIISIFIVATFTILFQATCSAQQADNFAGTLKINGEIELGHTPENLTAKFGQPGSTETVFWEMIEKNGTIYFYSGAEFDFVDNNLRSFIITSSDFQIYLDSFVLKIGNSINTISTLFPNSYSNRGAQGTAITLGSADYQYLNIKTNPEGEITEIELRFIP
ncbi:MAG: hypothetical protein EA390_05620 [Balneolaceae bacterium]|nr:MAG: hypothetical protein EA390_05620 [Balneolaceae bacterium]